MKGLRKSERVSGCAGERTDGRGRGACVATATAALLAPIAALALVSPGALAARGAPAATITPTQLAQMVLPRDLLTGGRFDVLPKSSSSGRFDIDDATRYTLDPKDTASDIAADGWVAGYDQSWGPGFAPDGAFFGGTTVQLFKSVATAALHHARQIESFRRFRGRLIEGGWTLASTTSWPLPGLGADAWAIHNVFQSSAGTFYDTELHLRLGRLIGEVGIISNRSTDLRRAIESNGRTLLLRMKRVGGAG